MHPVRDVYLDDILGMVGYEHKRAGPKRSKSKQAASVAPAARDIIETAIMQTFLQGSDADFDNLLEV